MQEQAVEALITANEAPVEATDQADKPIVFESIKKAPIVPVVTAEAQDSKESAANDAKFSPKKDGQTEGGGEQPSVVEEPTDDEKSAVQQTLEVEQTGSSQLIIPDIQKHNQEALVIQEAQKKKQEILDKRLDEQQKFRNTGAPEYEKKESEKVEDSKDEDEAKPQGAEQPYEPNVIGNVSELGLSSAPSSLTSGQKPSSYPDSSSTSGQK